MIQIENINKHIGGRDLFRDLNLTINEGDVIGIIGPSGCGKSLLLRCLIDLESIDSGSILMDGEDISVANSSKPGEMKKIGMVFQNFNLFQHMTVIENVMSGLVHLKNEEPKDAYDKAMNIIKSIGLADAAYLHAGALSGGQKQRAAIARTLAMEPQVILLDEPTSSLDPMMRGEIESVIRMMKAQGHTMVIVSHEMEMIREVCNRVIFLNDGIVYEEGTPDEIFEHPKKKATRRFVRALRVLEFDVESKDFDFIGSETKIAEFAFRNGLSYNLQKRLEAILEELFQMVIIQPLEENKMHIAFEFNRNSQALHGDVRFSGPIIDPDDPMFFFSWPIIERRASKVEVEEIDEDGFTNSVKIVIQ